MSKLYTCMITCIGGAYSFEAYDLPTNDEDEIRVHIEERGYKLLDVYSIKEQR